MYITDHVMQDVRVTAFIVCAVSLSGSTLAKALLGFMLRQ